jgi:hypothetical protein
MAEYSAGDGAAPHRPRSGALNGAAFTEIRFLPLPLRIVAPEDTGSTQRGCALWLRRSRAGIYLIGTLLVVAGVAYGASRLAVRQTWIVAGALVIVGIGLMSGIVKTRQKDPES